MKNLLYAFLLTLLLIGCSHLKKGIMAFEDNPFANDPKKISKGRLVYATNCAICHGNSGHGDGPGLTALTTLPPDFTQAGFDKSLGLIAANITYGKGCDMPSFRAVLSEKEIWDVSSYIKSLMDTKNKIY